MRLALELARRAQGLTSPNPTVGALIVKGGRVVGQGYHRRAGAPHAEVEALCKAGSRARGGTLYVTLEPCNHTGRTPPCCQAIIAAGISRVVAATRDPNPLTNGRGFAALRRAGITVRTGVLARDAERLNEPFQKVMTSGLPFVIAKVGQSLDGKIATRTGESRWITSPAARRLAHRLRSQVDAILVGANTVLQDDPLLTVRGALHPAPCGVHRAGRPMRIIVDSRLRTPVTARCVFARSPAPLLIATTCLPRRGAGTAVRSATKQRAFARRGVEVLPLPGRARAGRGRVPLRQLCQRLVRRGIHTVLIEGGGEVLASAFAERLVDRIVFFVAPILIGGRLSPSALGGIGVGRLARAIHLEDMVCYRVGPDLCIEARVVYPNRLAGLAGWPVCRSIGSANRLTG